MTTGWLDLSLVFGQGQDSVGTQPGPRGRTDAQTGASIGHQYGMLVRGRGSVLGETRGPH